MRFLFVVKFILWVMIFLSPVLIFLFPSMTGLFWDLSLYSVFVLMCIRPLADLFPSWNLRQFVSLRKHLGILSSIIVVTFGVLHYWSLGSSAFFEYFSFAYWTFKGGLFWAHLGELTGFILLITSNKLSMRLLKRNWKRVQRLSYVYFFSGSLYVFMAFGKIFGLIGIIIVLELTISAFFKKKISFEDEKPLYTGEL